MIDLARERARVLREREREESVTGFEAAEVPTASHVGLHNYKEAIEAYKKGLEIDPNNEALKSGLSDVMPERKRPAEEYECEEEEEANDAAATYVCTVLTHANLFVRKHSTVPIQPNEIEVDVSLSDGTLCKSELLACDFHYNLAALRIITNTPLQPAKMTSLDLTISIDPNQRFHLNPVGKSLQLSRPHSNIFKIVPEDKVIALARTHYRPPSLLVSYGNFRLRSPYQTESSLDCKELFCVKGICGNVYNGGPVVNYSGEMIGIMFHNSSLLPSNIISRWWKHYKSYREFRRPCIGFGVANLYTADAGFLEQLIQNFPSVSTGVLVEKVEQDSPAYCSGIRDFDVIIQFNGVVVQSTLEFYEKTWDKVGESVELKVLRASNGGQLKLTTMISEVTTDKFYSWLLGYKELCRRT